MNRDLPQTSAAVNSEQGSRFPPRPYKGLAGVAVGSLMTIAGILLIAFPISAVFFHPSGGEDIPGPGFLERVTRESSRLYGVLGLVLGPWLIWISRWPRWGKRNAAIEDYVWGLSQELERRFGMRIFYAIEDVSKIVRIRGYCVKFTPYAHAIFCSRADFDKEYRFRKEKLAYDELRGVVARRYFAGAREFDAVSVVRLARPPGEGDYDRWVGADGW